MTISRQCVLTLLLVSSLSSASCLAPPPAAATIPDACTDWRWIGVKTDPNLPCPTIGGGVWIERQLFSSLGTSPATIPPGLRPFCLYETSIQPTTTTSLLALVGGGLDSIAKDCTAVGPAADELDKVLWPAQAGRFARQNGAPLPPSRNATPQVRLALLDTSPTTPTSVTTTPANSFHGRSLAGLAEEILCLPDSTCRAVISSRLALPIIRFFPEQQGEFETDLGRGGYVGTIGQLAEAIAEEVDDWRKHGPEPRLVVNLSLGWSGERFGGLAGLEGDPGPPIEAVFRALEDAACRGVLIVAAAGNRAGSEDDSSPLLPAAWEGQSAPSSDECIEALGENAIPAIFNTGIETPRPLIWAAGGIDSLNHPLANARSLPRLVAYAEHAVAADPLDEPSMPSLTGSSVASIAVAATASALWHEKPSLTPAKVMERLYLQGRQLSIHADFHFGGGSPPEIRRLDGCLALARLCGDHPSLCPGPMTCVQADKSHLLLTESQLQGLQLMWGPALSSGKATGTIALAPPCTSQLLRYINSYGAPSALCPFEQLPAEAALPWTDPQPGLDPCPNCTLIPGGGGGEGGGAARLYLSISSEFDGVLTDPVLLLGPDSLALHVGPLVAGDAMFIEGLDLGTFDSAETIPVLTFVVDGVWSSASPLLVAEASEETEE